MSANKGENRRLDCSCCGAGFRGKQDPNHDKGFGTCEDCVKWTYERFTKPKLTDAANQIRQALKPENQAKFDTMSEDQRLSLAAAAIGDGLFSCSIVRR